MFVRAGMVSFAWVLMLCAASPVAAQGLVWNLPPDGTEAIYGGTLTQVDTRPGGEESTMTWERQLVIRSVGTQEVTHNGETVAGRWLEFELNTGQATEQGIDPGPVGRKVFRVLVAEPAVIGKSADDRGIPNAFLPIIEGSMQIGDRPVQKLDSNAFETYPSLTLLMNYKPNEIKVEAEDEPIDVPAGQYTASKHAAAAIVESPAGRVENKATLHTSPDMPFGLVRWSVEVVRARKDPNQSRDAYTPMSRVEEVMEARAINQNAQSTLPAPGA